MYDEAFLIDVFPSLHAFVWRETGEDPFFHVPAGYAGKDGFPPSRIHLYFERRNNAAEFEEALLKKLRAKFPNTGFSVQCGGVDG